MKEPKEVEERTAPTGRVVHAAIQAEGESELKRSSTSLGWSGLAAGLSMGFSFLGTAFLHAGLPDAPWSPLVSTFGYTLGFLVVILGRQQLFTENTLTVVLPLMEWRRVAVLKNVLRLWAVVLVTNIIGALIFAFVLARTEAVEADVFQALREVAARAGNDSFAVAVLRGVFAGWIIALVVWLGPFAQSSRIWVIIILTYIVGLGHFTHVIVSTIEAAFLVFVGDSSWRELVMHQFLPGLIGNVIGGVALVAALNHAQVVAGQRGIDD